MNNLSKFDNAMYRAHTYVVYLTQWLLVMLLCVLIAGAAQLFTKSWYPGDHNVQQLTDVQNGYVCWYTPFAIDCYPMKK